jgi:hypothetical protein
VAAYGGTAPVIDLPELADALLSVDIANTTYAALSMRDGDAFARPFTYAAADFFHLTITGHSGAGGTGAVVDSWLVKLADFTTPNAPGILSQWLTVDLAGATGVRSLSFALASSDNHPIFGMNTPAFFALDNLRFTVIPEPSSLALLALGVGSLTLAARRRYASDGSH